MKVFNNELVVQRGETLTISKIIQNKDGSPYIISNRLNNPYWLVTITENIFNYEGRYILNVWLPLKDALRFYFTKPVNLNDMGYTSWKDAELPAGYEGDETSGYANFAIFKLTENNETSYKYWKYSNNDKDDYTGEWTDYSCFINFVIGRDITVQWSEQNYYYSINLVDGEGIRTDDGAPISIIGTSYPILQSKKIYVKTDLNGGVL
jgi:hypothetical protein